MRDAPRRVGVDSKPFQRHRTLGGGQLVVDQRRERSQIRLARPWLGIVAIVVHGVLFTTVLTTVRGEPLRLGSSANKVRICSRARDNRDITVPTGTFRTMAASW